MSQETSQLSKEDWSERLTKIRPVLAHLWCLGNLELLKETKFLAIVGSRKMTDYGRRVLETLSLSRGLRLCIPMRFTPALR